MLNGTFRDDPYMWTDLHSPPVAVAKQSMIVVRDKDAKFFQNWTADYSDGDGIEHGKRIAARIGGTYAVLGADTQSR